MHPFITLIPTTTPGEGTPSQISALQDAIDTLQQQLDALAARVSSLEAQVAALISGSGGSGTTTPPSGPAYIDQDGHTYQAGGQIDFGGHSFMHEENVAVMLGGQQVGSAHADGGGNFSTGSMTLPTPPRTYTYTFNGQKGDSAQATIRIQ